MTVYFLLLVMFLNAVSYGMLIPLLYPYAVMFDLSPIQLSVLFSLFSLCQFISTPIIGKLSDRYGRKPMLLGSILGTSISLAMFASAKSVFMLFFSRGIDGLTGGNNSVATAMAADISSPKDRAKIFGLLGASQGLGFVIGPALGGLLSAIHITAPFWIASLVALVSVIFGVFALPETRIVSTKSQTKIKLNFSPAKLLSVFSKPVVGLVLLISLMVSLGHNTFVLGFQAHTNNIMKLSTGQIGLLFTLVGVVIALMQAVGIKTITKFLKSERKIVTLFLMATCLVILPMGLINSLWLFAAFSVLYSFSFSPLFPVFSSLISANTSPDEQGSIMGIQQSIFALGSIIGPLVAGVVISVSLPASFLAGGMLFGVGLLMSRKLMYSQPGAYSQSSATLHVGEKKLE